MVGDNKSQADSMYRVYRESRIQVSPSGHISRRTSYFSSYARELSSDPSTLIDKPEERTSLDRMTDEDFLP